MKKRLVAFFIIIVLLSAGVPCTFADTGNSGFVRVETGEAHVVALKSDGTVWTWGSNMAGALGDGTERSRYVPTRVEEVDGIVDVAAGRGFSVALKSDGTVWGWGNYWVRLGLEYNARQLDGLYNIVAISINDTDFYALDAEGTIYLNYEKTEMIDFPYKKRDTTNKYDVFSLGRYGIALGIKKNGSVWHNGVEIAEFKGAKDVAAFQGASGENTGYVVLGNGEIVAIGSNRYGQLGNGFTSHTNVPQKVEGISDVKDVSALHNIYVLHNDGTVSTMFNRNSESRFIKVPISDVKKITQTVSSTIVLKNDGTVWEWPVSHNSPDSETPEPVKIEELSNIVNISATQGGFLAFDKNGKIANRSWNDDLSEVKIVTDGYAEGDNLILLTEDNKIFHEYDYSIGGGSFDSVPVRKHRELKEVDINGTAKQIEVKLPDISHPIVLKEDGTICVLSSTKGIDEYTDVSDLPEIVDIRTNFQALLALGIDGNVWQLGTDGGNSGADDDAEYNQPYHVPGLSDIKTVAAGNDYYFAITNDGELYAWGENGNNQLFPSDYYTNYASWKPVKSSVINMNIENPIILVNNYAVQIPAAPVIIGSRTLVPIREVAENLGATVEWEDSGMITVKLNDNVLIMNIGSLDAQYNGNLETIDVAPAIINEKTFLPLRYVCEKLGADVLWEDVAQRITITK